MDIRVQLTVLVYAVHDPSPMYNAIHIWVVSSQLEEPDQHNPSH